MCVVGNKMALLQVFLPVLLFSHIGFIVIFIYMLLLPEGEMAVAWEPSKKQIYFRFFIL